MTQTHHLGKKVKSIVVKCTGMESHLVISAVMHLPEEGDLRHFYMYIEPLNSKTTKMWTYPLCALGPSIETNCVLFVLIKP